MCYWSDQGRLMCEKDHARAEMEQEQSKRGRARERKQKQRDTVCQSHCFLTVFWTQWAFFATLKPETRIVVSHRWCAHYSSCKTCFFSSATMTPPQHVYLCVWRLTWHLLTSWNSQVTALWSSPAVPCSQHLAPHLHVVKWLSTQTLHKAYSAQGILCARHTLHEVRQPLLAAYSVHAYS